MCFGIFHQKSYLQPCNSRTEYATKEAYDNHFHLLFDANMSKIRHASPESFEGRMVSKVAHLNSRQKRTPDGGGIWTPERDWLFAEGRLGYGLLLCDMNVDELQQQVNNKIQYIQTFKPKEPLSDSLSEAEWEFAMHFMDTKTLPLYLRTSDF